MKIMDLTRACASDYVHECMCVSICVHGRAHVCLCAYEHVCMDIKNMCVCVHIIIIWYTYVLVYTCYH